MRTLIAVLCLLPLLAACSRDHRTDLQKFTDFHKQMAVVDQRIDAATSAYNSASKAALNSNNHAALYAAASAFRLSVVATRPQMEALRVPDFKTKDVDTFARQAQAALSARISAWERGTIALKAMTDPTHPDPGVAAAAAQAQDEASSDAVAQASAIMLAYQALGITPDQVDTKHGGLKADKAGKADGAKTE
jgi:hypothetical protein